MPVEKKVKTIEELKAMFARSNVGVFTDYRGLTVKEMTDLRRTLRQSNIKYRVVKNTLARIAAERAGKKQLLGLFEGPLAIAFGYGDLAEPARILSEYIRTNKLSLTIKGGFLEDRVLAPADVEALATLPNREILIAQVWAGLQSPLVNLVNYLMVPMSGLIGLLQARMKQMEGK